MSAAQSPAREPTPPAAGPVARARGVWAAAVAAAMAAYYFVFFLPPRQLGRVDPDRFYHLGLAALTAGHGFLRSLPQVDDLGWGRYFPDKEFLFHLLGGAAYQLGGPGAVLMLVPVLGSAIALLLYASASRAMRPRDAAVLVVAGLLLTAAYLFRLTLLRPHLLSILMFSWLVIAMLRGRSRQAIVAAAGFALSYHAFYLPVLVAGLGWAFRRRLGEGEHRAWLGCLFGLLLGIILNPYFPSNLVMSLFHVEVALGIDRPPGSAMAVEVLPLPLRNFVLLYGFLPASLLLSAVAVRAFGQPASAAERGRFWFLYALTLALTLLALKSARATEYAIPCGLLMVAHAAPLVRWRAWTAANLALLVAIQGYAAQRYYIDAWRRPEQGASAAYAAALAAIPADAAGRKVFNCEWEAGAFVLYFRPDLRFVDLLDPAFLWRVSRTKHLVRLGLMQGKVLRPADALRDLYAADYVLCAAPAFNRQMDADSTRFAPLFGAPGDALRVFALRPEPAPGVDAPISARPRTD